MTDRLSTTIWVESLLPGFHRWPDAPKERDHLASRHRHVFKVRLDVLVLHDERDVEFHELTERLRHWWGPGEREWGGASCEAVARLLMTDLSGDGMRVMAASVSIDGEGGATVRREEP
ncbi:hypothetical protein [Streptomyces sp. WAC06614]|uniref:hypothetical protein n=1 Tax=Streptomyces sp. WAC06614 TaxID=2487416 RepID=UPI000F7A41E9|nr:hypothetical protein [Streptomyces sp. WAC06614]RSS69854.1 hypothetical protein EF918_27580 [Streptomyces sp. WAC06614]